MALDDYTREILTKLQVDAQDRPFYTPALLAYFRGVGMSLSQAEDNRAASMFSASRAYQQDQEGLQRGYEQGRKSITGGLQSRGVLMSGEAIDRYNKQDEEKARASNQLDTGLADRRTAIDTAYRQVEDSLRQQSTERLLGAEQDDATRRATEDAQKRQQEELMAYYSNLGGQ